MTAPEPEEFAASRERLKNGFCPAPGCARSVRFGRLGCTQHWYTLPTGLRALINRAWLRLRRDGTDRERREEHERWKTEAFRFWETGRWNTP